MPKSRPKRRVAKDGNATYVQVGRVLDVLDVLKDGPRTTAELSAALNVSERTTFRFMGAMLRMGWPVLYHKATTSAQLKWNVDMNKLWDRLIATRRKS